MMNQEVFGRKVRERRKGQGLTQDEVGQALGVSAQAVSKWEQGESLPDVALLPSLCRVLGVSADRLLGIEEVGIESLSQELGRQIHQRRGRARDDILMQVLPWLHQDATSPVQVSHPVAEVSYHWDDGRLHTLQFWSDRGVSCTLLSGALASEEAPSGEVLEKLRALLEPSCWKAAQLLLSGPKKRQELEGSGEVGAVDSVVSAIDTLIEAGLVIQDRNGYRLDDQHGVLLTGIIKALSHIPRLHGVEQQWHTSDRQGMSGA